MRIKILDQPVRQNVELFLKIMRRVKQNEVQRSLPSEKIFRAWLHRGTGQLSFSEVMEGSQDLGSKEWKPVELAYQYDPVNGEIQFLVQEVQERQAAFHSDDLAPIAFRILRDTMKILREISKRLQGPSDLNTKISVLTKLTIDVEVPHADHNILIDAWHPIDRMEAEALLKNLPVGTYLFRKDIYAGMLEEQLEKQLHKKIKCFTLTFSQKKGKVSDLTLVHVDAIWQIYDDDPSLEQKSHRELNDLLGALKSVLKYPLYRVL
jgi:hypothetical protein